MRGESLSHFCPFFFSSFLERCEGRGECSNDKRNVNWPALWNNNTGRWQADSWWQILSTDRAHKETGGGIKNEPGPVLQARGKPRLSTSTHRETDNVNINTPWWLLSDKCKQALHTYTPTTAPKKIITKKKSNTSSLELPIPRSCCLTLDAKCSERITPRAAAQTFTSQYQRRGWSVLNHH